MEAHLTRPTSIPVEALDGPLLRIARQVFALGAALVLLLCLVVVVRGVLGAFGAPASIAMPILATALAELLASAFRIVWSRLYPQATQEDTRLFRVGVPFLCVVCISIALSLTPTPAWAVGGLWLIVAAGEAVWWYPEIRRVRRRSAQRSATLAIDPTPLDGLEEDRAFDDEELAANVVQQITRSRNDDGVEVISGVLRAEFAQGERTHHLHVAFCPPLMYEPHVDTHQLDGSPMIVKVAQAEIFGTRIELRLSAAATASERSTIYFAVRPR